MTKKLVDEPFNIGYDNFSLKQYSKIGEEMTRYEFLQIIENKLNIIINKLDKIIEKR